MRNRESNNGQPHNVDDGADEVKRSCRHLRQRGVQHIIQHAHCAREKATCEVHLSTSFLDSLDSFHHFAKFFGAHLFRSTAIHNIWSYSLPRDPKHLLHPTNTSLFCPFFSRGHVLPDGAFSMFPNFWTRILVHHICLASSCICVLFRITCIDTCPLPRTTVFDASVSFLIAFGDEPLRLRHLFFFFLRAVCLHVCHFHQDASVHQFMLFLSKF